MMNLRKGFMILALAIFATTGCVKNDGGCKPQDPSIEDAAMLKFIDSIGMNATKLNKGMYYEILNQGSASHPKQESIIYCTYRGTLLNGTEFDSQSNPGQTGFQLNGLIEAWKIAVPYIGKGGRIRMVVPSSLGYGCKGGGTTIPPNTPLFFDLTLVDFF
ncbi:MAG TPA: FKBP-type peptidyl-prolyl cis-trans isomerase [Phnomibacter sp.]|nr:FKBP-type peptidyl-prolyl cis-trans isomerase [Phnomibacter sp.]